MSKTVDERVVSMQLENQGFEKNAEKSISTIERLKQSLNFGKTAKGFEEVGNAAKNCDVSALGKGVETVQAKFSALQVVGVTALANLANSAVNTGKKIIKSLTIEPVTTGFNEYELKMDSVRTIMASTGKSVDVVNGYLEELNKYSDQTIYSFSDMTQNIGKFTNAGVELEDAVMAIKGISNEAAVSGANANEASRAMYNFAQALSAGYVKLIDWKSIENANMATKEFKEQLIGAGLAAGTVTKAGDGMYKTLKGTTFNATKNFNETLQEQWMTTEVLVKTLKDYADNTTEIGKKAFAAAQDVTKLSQMFDVLKETAQSGWARTWEILFGDIEKAKALFTPLTNFFSNIINKISDFRNNLLEGALGKPFKKLSSVLDGFNKKSAKTVEGMKKLGNIVDRVIRGDFKNAPVRFQKLTKAGYNWAQVQNLVNKRLGSSVRHNEKLGKAQEKNAKAQKDNQKSQEMSLETLASLNKEELKKLGFTKEEIADLKDLQKAAEEAGMSMERYLEIEKDRTDGRTLLLSGLENIGKSIEKIFKAIGKAWTKIFPPMTARQIYDIISKFQAFSGYLMLSNDSAKKLRQTFQGLFAILDIVLTIVGGPIKILFKIFTQLLESMDMNILDVTAGIGKAIVAFRDWLDKVLDFSAVFEYIAPYVKEAAAAIREWLVSLKDSTIVKTVSGWISQAVESIKELVESFGDTPKDIMTGFANGITTGAKTVFSKVIEFAKMILEKFKDVLGIHSPSTETFEIGWNFILGFFNAIKEGAIKVWGWIKTFGQKSVDTLKSVFKNIDFGKILAAAMAIGGLVVAFKGIKAAINIAQTLTYGVKDLMSSVGDMFNSLSGYLDAKAWNIKTKSMLNVAKAIGIVAVSVFLLAQLPAGKLWATIGAIATLSGMMVGLAFAANKLSAAGFDGKPPVSILSIAASVLIISIAMKKLSGIENPGKATATLIGIVLALSIVLAAYGFLVQGPAANSIDKAGKMLFKVSIAMLIMVKVINAISKLDDEAIVRGLIVMGFFEALCIRLIAVSYFAGEHASKAGSMLLKMSIGMLIMVAVVKLAGSMKPDEVLKGLSFVAAVEILFAAIIAVSKYAGKHAAKAGAMILQMSLGMLAMIAVMKIASKMSTKELAKGLGTVIILEALMAGIIKVAKSSGKNAAKIGTMMLAISGALLIMTVVIFLCGQMDPKKLAIGTTAVSILMGLMMGLIAVTKKAKVTKDTQKTLLIMMGTIVILSGVLITLSCLDPAKVGVAAAALSSVIGVFALFTYVTQYLKSGEKTYKRNMATLITLTGIVVLLAGVMVLLAQCNPQSAVGAAVSLGVLLLAMSGAMLMITNSKSMNTAALVKAGASLLVLSGIIAILGLILKNMQGLNPSQAIGAATSLSILLVVMTGAMIVLGAASKFATKALLGIVALTAMAIPLLAFVGVLAVMQNVQVATQNVMALVALATAATLLLIPLSLVGFLVAASGGTTLLGIVALTAMAIPLLAFVGVLAVMQNVQNATTNVLLLTTLLTVMSDVLFKISLVAPLAVIAVAALGALTLLMGAIGVFAVAIGALVTKLPQLEQFLDVGLPILEKLAYGIGSIVGKLISGFATGIASGLPEIGLLLSQFMVNATPFITGVKMVDSKVMDGVKILAASIMALTIASLIESIAQFMSSGQSFASLGTELTNFYLNAAPFLVGMTMINTKALEGVKTLAETILILTAANVIDGLTSWFAGGQSLADFGSQVGYLASGVKSFSDNLGDMSEKDVLKAQNAADVIKTIAQASAEIPNSGGWLGAIVGENDAGSWGEQLGGLGTGVKDFVSNLGDKFNDDNVVKIAGRAADIIVELAKAASEIPASGGWLQGLVGDADIGEFGGKLPELATHIGEFVTNLINAGLTADTSSIDIAKNGIKILAEIIKTASEIPNTGGVVAAFSGDNDIQKFSKKLPDLANNIGDFIANLNAKGVTTDSVNIAKTGSDILWAVAHSCAKISEVDTGKVLSLGYKLSELGGYVSEFVSTMATITKDSIDAAKKKVDGVVELVEKVVGMGNTDLSAFGNSLKNLAENGIKGFTGAFAADTTKTNVKTAAENMAKAAISALKTQTMYDDYKSAGSYAVSGFCAGINNNLSSATAAGTSLGEAALKAAKKALKEKSPSKAMYQVGDYAGIGYVNAVLDNVSSAYKAGSRMGEASMDGLRGVISRITDVVNSDIDTQPTIRPVLDLSSVTDGSRRLNGMFNLTPSVGMIANVGSVNTMMSRRQNDVNADILSAIKDLKNSGSTGNTYIIDGITYDDGSNITGAVEQLIRYAKVERRV